MDKFTATLKKRLAFAALYNAAVLLLVGLGIAFGSKLGLDGLGLSFSMGFFVGIQIVMVYFIGKYLGALKSEEKRSALYIEENDERNKFIEAKIGGVGINVIMCGLSLAVLVTVYLNNAVFFALLGALLFCALVKFGLKVYYRSKI
ncbi:MAG TPA: hypothetical protein PKB13_06670 [Clostridia bacterium]|nr:hypothetical protein [Clostridia bacterium]